MSLVKWSPEKKFFPAVTNWMEDFFDDRFFNDRFVNDRFFDEFRPMVKGVTMPAVNVAETDKMFKMEMAIPGFKKEDFHVEVKENYLVVSGETKMEKTEKEEKYNRREFRFSSFERSFVLPDNVNAEKIKAHYENGILTLELPKVKEERAVPVKSISVN
jgi:HSP20 family protein